MTRAVVVLAGAAAVLSAGACASSGGTARQPLPSPGSAVVPSEPVPYVLAASDLLERSRAEQEAGRYGRADSTLLRVWSACGVSPAGSRALLLLAGLRLDPRNQLATPDAAARAAASYLSLPGTPAWTRPLARQLYLLALELGARPLDASPAAGPGPPAPPDSAARAAPDSNAVGTARDSGSATTVGDPSGTEAAAPPAAGSDISAAGLPPRACGIRNGQDVEAREATGLLPALRGESMAARVAKLQDEVAALKRELDRIRKTIHP